MSHIRSVLHFGLKYLRPYWGRLLAGVLFSILFALSNGSFVWIIGTLMERLDPDAGRPAPAQAETVRRQSAINWLPAGAESRLKEIRTRINTWTDPWLPRSGRDLTTKAILGCLLLLPLLGLLYGGTDYLSNYCIGWVSERVINDLRTDLLAKLSTLSLDYFTNTTTGDLVTRINADTMNLHRALRQGSADLLQQVFMVIVPLLYMLVIDIRLTLIVMVVMPACLLPLLVLGRKARRASRASRRATVSQSSLILEMFNGIRVVKAFGLEEEQLGRFRAEAHKLVHHGMKGVQAKEMVTPFMQVLMMLGAGALVVYIFAMHYDAATLVKFIACLLLLFTPLKKLAGVHILFEQAAVGIERLTEVFNEQPSVREPAVPKSFPPFGREIHFDNVSFAYRSRTGELMAPVLRGIDLTVPRGFKLGVAGESGSGKSTLLNLIYRFYDPTSGAVRIDGLDVRELAGADLRSQMAIVSQEIVIFDQSVASNIGCGRRGATREEIIAAARAAFAHEFIEALPEGYDTRLGERGTRLSVGQRQRITIARAFVRNAPILILDEATASLDSQSEGEVQAAIERLEQNRTVICVAHRLSTLAAMDHIVVLKQGRIVEAGSFAELLRLGGVFADMARRQGIVAKAA